MKYKGVANDTISMQKRRISIKKAVRIDSFLQKGAPQVGLEPTTYGLTVRRSNQLSY